jgi:hypothetical protein
LHICGIGIEGASTSKKGRPATKIEKEVVVDGGDKTRKNV